MRMILDWKMPLEPFNSMVRAGTAGANIQKVLKALNAEAVYFSARGASRGGLAIVDVADASKIPSLAEPLFLTFNATVEFHPCMTPEDLGKAGLDELGKAFG